MPFAPTSALIFDWHGVLDLTAFESIATQLAIAAHKTLDETNKLIREEKTAFATDNITSADFWGSVQDILNVTDQEIAPIKTHSLKLQKNEPLWSALPTLRKKYRLAILSDCPTDKAAVIRNKINLDFFEQVVFSCEVNMSKGDDAFFLRIAAILKLNTAEILYIDDTETHIQRAQRLGFQTHHFRSTSELLEVF
jgi:FMN phosphatase YigB (HAD superfamily)